MVEQHLAGGDGHAHRHPVLEGPGRNGRPRLLPQLRTRVGVAELEQVLDLERAGDAVDVGRLELERSHQRRDDGVGRAGGDLEPHRRAAIAAPQLLLDRRDQVLRLLLVDLQVPVAGDTEAGGVQDGEAREEVAGVGGDHLVEQAVLDPGVGRQAHEARQHRRHLHHRQQHLHVAPPLPAGPPQDQGHVERLVAQLRERMARVDGEGGEDREDLLREALPRRLGLPGREVLGSDQLVARPGERRPDLLEPGPVLLRHQRVGPAGDGSQHLGRQQAVGRRVGHATGDLLLQARHADHEELVEVGGDDAEELEPLQHRQGGVLGLLEDAGVELEPGELAIEEERWVVQLDGARGTGFGGRFRRAGGGGGGGRHVGRPEYGPAAGREPYPCGTAPYGRPVPGGTNASPTRGLE